MPEVSRGKQLSIINCHLSIMLRVGLTGSIAVGKTFVDNAFRELGVPVLDADQVARDVVEPGTVGLQRVIEEFGDSVVTANGSLDRAKLGSIVFNDEEKRLKLNSIKIGRAHV